MIGSPPQPALEQSGARMTIWLGGRVVMQRPAKPWTPVRFRPQPPRFQDLKKALNKRKARVAKLVDARDLKSLGT